MSQALLPLLYYFHPLLIPEPIEELVEMIVDSNTPWKGSLSMQEVMEIFDSFLNSMESSKVEKQNRLEERKRQSTQF